MKLSTTIHAIGGHAGCRETLRICTPFVRLPHFSEANGCPCCAMCVGMCAKLQQQHGTCCVTRSGRGAKIGLSRGL